jgi:hypothetical protein
MLFREIRCLVWESYETHKYKMQSYWTLKHAPLGFKGLKSTII